MAFLQRDDHIHKPHSGKCGTEWRALWLAYSKRRGRMRNQVGDVSRDQTTHNHRGQGEKATSFLVPGEAKPKRVNMPGGGLDLPMTQI